MNFDSFLSQRNFPSDDAVTLGIRSFARHLIATFSCWMLSFILLMIHHLWNPFPILPWISFAFLIMCIGSLYGVASIILLLKSICFTSKLITRQEREYLLYEETEFLDGKKLIDYDSLLLLRYFLCFGGVICVTLIVILISQVLFSIPPAFTPHSPPL
jgi:hypothetical protein